jgi:hypothetical protein
VAPEAAAEDMDEGSAAPMEEEDMAEVEKHRAARMAEAAAAELRKRSKAIQRGLPRPAGGEVAPATTKDAALAAAHSLVAAEMRSLLAHDAVAYPPPGATARHSLHPHPTALCDKSWRTAHARSDDTAAT